MLKTLIIFLFCFPAFQLSAQYFQFSQYNFTPQRINPASVASSDYASANFIYRHQSTDGGVFINSNSLNASYPLISRSGRRWSGVGLSFLHDQAGPSGIFVAQEVGLSYAVNVPFSKNQSLALGFRAVHSSREVRAGRFATGLQYVPERGFDNTQSNGEDMGDFNRKFLTFSSGFSWQKNDRKGNRLASFGVSFFDFNRPDESFADTNDPYPSTIVSALSFRLSKKDKLSLFPEVLFTHNAGINRYNAGFVTSYELKSYRKAPSDKIDLLTKYLSGKTALIGIQLHREKFAFGLSYDFPLSSRNVSNTGAVEMGVIWKKLVSPSRKAKRKKKQTSEEAVSGLEVADKIESGKSLEKKDTAVIRPNAEITMAQRLKTKRDSLEASARAGKVQHEALILEKADLRFNFSFNSIALDEQARAFLDEVVQALLDNPELRIELTGHTDDVGSAKFNLKLSLTRADAIKAYLVEKGVDEGRVETSGKGMSEPLNNNLTEDQRALNRRVEMKIVYDY